MDFCKIHHIASSRVHTKNGGHRLIFDGTRIIESCLFASANVSVFDEC